MKELFDNLKKTDEGDLILLDTCFFIDTFHNHKEKELLELARKEPLAMTTFNLEELDHVIKKVKDKSIKERVRSFLKNKPPLLVVDVPVHPGNMEAEKKYVHEIDPYLAQDIPDPSDAVLIAAAIKTHSIVLTKDKHHLFTTLLENYIKRWGLHIYKDLKELEKSQKF